MEYPQKELSYSDLGTDDDLYLGSGNICLWQYSLWIAKHSSDHGRSGKSRNSIMDIALRGYNLYRGD
jgi:hypothetical protein